MGVRANPTITGVSGSSARGSSAGRPSSAAAAPEWGPAAGGPAPAVAVAVAAVAVAAAAVAVAVAVGAALRADAIHGESTSRLLL